MGVYLGHDKVAGPGAFCNVSGSVSKNLYDKNNVYIEGASNQNASNKIKIEPNTTYTFSIGEYTWGEIQEFNSFGTQTNHFGGSENDKIITFTTSPNAKYIRAIFYTGADNVDIGTIDFTQIQLEKGSTATEYEKYYEPTVSIRDSNGVFQKVELNTPVMLYTSESGTFDSITLTEEAENFKYVEVFGVGNTMICSVKIPMDLYNTGSLFTAGASYQYHCGVSLTGKSMTFVYNRRLNISSNAWDNGNYFKIYRIVGYR